MKMISSNPKRLPLLFGVMIFLLATLDAQVTNGQVAGKDFVPGEILLKFRQPLSGQQLSGFLMANGLQLKKRISISEEIFLLEAPGVTNINPKVDSLIANSFVDFAEPNFYGYLHAFPHRLHENEMARRLGISRSWVQKLCRQAFGLTFTRLMRRIWVHQALRMMQHTNLDNVEIAVQLNYSEESSLARDFRKELGYNPTEARKRLVEQSPEALLR